MARPVRPEPKYFLNDGEFHQGINYYLDKYFKEVKDTTNILGEKGTSYLEYSFVASRIHTFFSTAKIFIILRNPVDRALSNYYFSVQNGLETRTLREVFIQKINPPTTSTQISVSPFNYLERGHYLQLIQPYFDIFKANVKIILFEETLGNLESIQTIYKFLDIDCDFIPPSINKKINESNHNLYVADETEVREELHSYFKPHIKLLENFMNREIEVWHD